MKGVTQENVEVVRRVIDAGNRRNRAELARLYSPEAEIDWSRSRGPLRGVYRGRAEIRRFSMEFYSAFEDVQTVAHDFTAIGSDVLVSNTAHLRGRDGIKVVARSTYVYTVENGQIARLRMFQERAEALEAARLRE